MFKATQRATTPLALALSAGVASATSHSAAGPQFSASCNENGARLTVEGKATVFLGKSCDAHIVGRGDGRWYAFGESFIVDAGGTHMNFGVRAVPCDLPTCTQF